MITHEFLWNKKWLWFLILFGVAFLLSFVTPLRLDEGGELTCLSMLVLCMIGYFFGGVPGVIAGIGFGALRFLVQYPYPDNIAELIDDLAGFGLLGVCGFFIKKEKIKLFRNAFLLAAALRYVESVWNCIFFYYRTDMSFWWNLKYGLVYCGGYIGVETIITFVILCVPPVMEAIDYLKYISSHPYDDDLESY